MTREMAIQILGCYGSHFCWENGESIPASAVKEAVGMAISALSPIDLPRTNREALMEEMDGLDNAEFERAVLCRRAELPEALDAAMCRDCRRMHGDSCPSPGDDPCPISIADWLSMPCKHKRLIPEVRCE